MDLENCQNMAVSNVVHSLIILIIYSLIYFMFHFEINFYTVAPFLSLFFNEHLLRHVIYILVQRANYWQFVSSLVEAV